MGWPPCKQHTQLKVEMDACAIVQGGNSLAAVHAQAEALLQLLMVEQQYPHP
jgi:hypothetical protein